MMPAPRFDDRPGDAAWRAVADPTRRAIVLALRTRPYRSAGDLRRVRPGISRTALSHHLMLLLDAGLLNVRRQGARRLYSYNHAGGQALLAELDELIAGEGR